MKNKNLLHDNLNNKIKNYIEDVDKHFKKDNLSKKDIEAQYNKIELEDQIKEKNLMLKSYKVGCGNFKILLVDDDKQVLNTNHLFITEKSDFQNIYFAENGIQALEQVKKHNFDLILSDYRMPELDGRKLKIELDKQNYQGIFVLISGYIEPEMKHLRDDGVLLIPKPFKIETLIKVVKSAYLLKMIKEIEE